MLERILDELREQEVAIAEKVLASQGTSLTQVKEKLDAFRIEIPCVSSQSNVHQGRCIVGEIYWLE